MSRIKAHDRVRDIKTIHQNAAPKVREQTGRIKEQTDQSKAADYEGATDYADRQVHQVLDDAAYKAKDGLRRPFDSIHRRRRAQTKTQKNVRKTQRSVKAARKTVKTTAEVAKKTAKAVEKTAKTTAKVAQRAVQVAQKVAQATVKGVQAAIKATVAVIKAIIAAVQGLIAAIAAGGWVAVAIILTICMLGFILASPYGIFYSQEAYGGGQSMQEVIVELNDEFYAEIERIENASPHDILEVTASDGLVSVDWVSVLSIYAVKTAAAQDSETEVATLDEAKKEMIRSILWEMNQISHSTRTERKTIEITKIDEYGEEYVDEEVITETILTIHVTHKTRQEMTILYDFDANQNTLLEEMLSPEYEMLWVGLIGAYRDAHGQIIFTNSEWIGTDIFTWPLQYSYEITSTFGWRMLRGEPNYHEALDIGAPFGTPILAAADGVVVAANATDEWGFGLGYYVRIEHNGTYTTTYAHCSAIAVTNGQTVQQGQVIGFVGSTGNSTGNHVHFEVIRNGGKVDPLQFFAQ